MGGGKPKSPPPPPPPPAPTTAASNVARMQVLDRQRNAQGFGSTYLTMGSPLDRPARPQTLLGAMMGQ